MRKKNIWLAALISLVGIADADAGLTFTGNTLPVLTEPVEASTGLNDLYVLNSVGGVKATYTAASSSAQVCWYRYSALGGGFAEEITDVSHNGTAWTLNRLEGDMGYIVEEGSDRYYCWVVDYGQHRFSLSGLASAPEQDCDLASLTPHGYGDRIVYYSINGRQMELSRDIELTYNTLEPDESAGYPAFKQIGVTTKLAWLQPTIHTRAPLCNTTFTLSGDKFLRRWGQEASVTSDTYQATAVQAVTTATQTPHEADNEQQVGSADGSLGGSAPAEIKFEAAVSDAAVFTEWQMSRSPEFDLIDMRMNQLETTYTFTEHGTTYVRFVAANAAGTCEYISQTYEVFIGDSALQCPNAFSPGASEGVNDIWKVSYKSLVSFECHIFNRWGVEMATLTSPDQGWDGRYGGKVVPSGVYYYVITAKGADGKKYKLSGDINVVNYK